MNHPLRRFFTLKSILAVVVGAWLIVSVAVHFHLPGLSAEAAPAPPIPPRFLSRTGAASFTEMMAEPPSFIYGSSIHLWVYEEGDAMQEVAVTGHADSSTCERVSGLFFNALLQKAEEPEDVFVAGAGWLVRREDDALRKKLENESAVKKYRELRQQHALAELKLAFSRREAVESGKKESALDHLKGEAEQLGALLDAQRKEPKVIQYVRQLQSGEAIDTLVRETKRVSESSGLVEVHVLPHQIAVKARERVRTAAASSTAAVISFEDLLGNTHEAVVFMDVLRTGGAIPLTLTIPAAALSSDAFEEAKRNNRKGVEYAMIGDAEERIRFYGEKMKSTEHAAEECAQASPAERAKEVSLGETCTADGACYKSDHPTKMTYDEYCKKQIPRNLKIIREWDEGAKSVLKQIEGDRREVAGGKVDRMNHATMVDSLLRDWALPLSAGQGAFDTWREQLRGPIWETLRLKLVEARVDPDVIMGENIVFSVAMQGGDLVVRPLHVVDLARSVVVIDPRAGATRLVDAWASREVVQSSGPLAASQGILRTEQRVDRAIEQSGGPISDGGVEAVDALKGALASDPAAAIRRVETRWLQYSRDDGPVVTELTTKILPTLTASDILIAFGKLADDPDLKDKPSQQLKQYRELLEAHPMAPVDLHLRLAIEVAEFLTAMDAVAKDGGPSVDAWSIVEAYIQDGHADPCPLARSLLRQEIDHDPAVIVHDAIARVQVRAPSYWERARSARGMPEIISDELKGIETDTEAHSLFEIEALAMKRMQDLLTRSAWATKAAAEMVASDAPELGAVVLDLKNASPGEGALIPPLIAARERVKGFLDANYHPDTLARMEVASEARRGGEQLVNLANEFFPSEFSFLRGLRDHTRLGARALYEAGEYRQSLELMYPEKVALSLYHADLKWETMPHDWIGVARSIRARLVGGEIVVAAAGHGWRRDVLRLRGLTGDAARGLVVRINDAKWQPMDSGKVSDQILMLEIPVADAPKSLRGFVTGPARLAILRAMVYGCAPPAEDLIPVSGRCVASKDKDRYDRMAAGPVVAIHVPSLEEIKRRARERAGAAP